MGSAGGGLDRSRTVDTSSETRAYLASPQPMSSTLSFTSPSSKRARNEGVATGAADGSLPNGAEAAEGQLRRKAATGKSLNARSLLWLTHHMFSPVPPKTDLTERPSKRTHLPERSQLSENGLSAATMPPAPAPPPPPQVAAAPGFQGGSEEAKPPGNAH